ncbi:MAG TPA: hypothetical protein VL994_14640 [Steroidobacteraceae bacterium]|nr:hypothetical protein [Steroidobacteraceae bacterium]
MRVHGIAMPALIATLALGGCSQGRGEAQAARDAQHVAVLQDQKAETAAEGMHRLALAQCETLTGGAFRSCRDEADADYELARMRAKLARAEVDPKP